MKVSLGILFVIFLTSNANALTFSDGTFHDADWTIILNEWGTGGGSVVGSQQATGGNPDYYRQVIDTVGAWYTTTLGNHLHNNFVYNPSLQGDLISIDFSMQAKMFIGFNAGQNTGFLISQGGLFYNGPGFLANVTEWKTLSAIGLTETDFSVFDNPALHPNFSTSGSPITFGFYSTNSGSGYSITGGVDNWSVTLHTATVPLPSAVLLLGAGLSSLAIYRRRKMKAKN